MIYFDNAATSGKKPAAVINAVSSALKNLSANPGRSGHAASVRAASAIYETRNQLAEFFGASGAEHVIFTSGCTAALNTVIKGTVKRGEHVVISDLEHNSVIRPLKKVGARTDMAPVSLDDPQKTLASFEKLITKDTKLVICTAASNVTGTILPISEIGALCRRLSIPFAVDAAQGAGIIPINMQKMNIEYLCLAPHKGLYAPMGVGVLIADGELYDTLIEGGTGTNSIDPVQPLIMPEGFESGTVNLPGIIGTSAGLDFVRFKGCENIHRYENGLTGMLYRELRRTNGILLYTPDPDAVMCAPVLPFNIDGMPSDAAAAELDRMGFALRAGLHCAPTAHKKLHTVETGAIRFAPSIFNTKTEVAALVHAVREIIRKKI